MPALEELFLGTNCFMRLNTVMLKGMPIFGPFSVDLPALVQMHLSDQCLIGSTEKACIKSGVQPYNYSNCVVLESFIVVSSLWFRSPTVALSGRHGRYVPQLRACGGQELWSAANREPVPEGVGLFGGGREHD